MSRFEAENRPFDPAELLGAPPLLPGESASSYAALEAEVERALKPNTIFDLMRVRTITDALWEEQRFKGFEAKLIEGGKVNALAVLMTPYMKYFREHATSLAQDYYSPDPHKSKPAAAKVAEAGITLDMINAKAASIEASNLALFDRLIGNRQVLSRALVNDQERRERKAKKSEKRANGVAPAAVAELATVKH